MTKYLVVILVLTFAPLLAFAQDSTGEDTLQAEAADVPDGGEVPEAAVPKDSGEEPSKDSDAPDEEPQGDLEPVPEEAPTADVESPTAPPEDATKEEPEPQSTVREESAESNEDPPNIVPETASETDPGSDGGPSSGYRNKSALGGPEAVMGQLAMGDRLRDEYAWDGPQHWLFPYYGFKEHLAKNYGLKFGFFVSLLGQKASDSLTGDDNALGAIYRFFGAWTLFDNPTTAGRFEWRLEYRGRLLTEVQSTGDLKAAIGAVNDPSAPYSEFDLDLGVIAWTQTLFEDRWGFTLGRLAFDAYQDTMAFQTPAGGFLNHAFFLNTTAGKTGVGALGMATKAILLDFLTVGGGIFDANAVNGKFDPDTITEGEFLKSVELGLTPSLDRRKTDMINFTYWHRDQQTLKGTPSGQGWLVSSTWNFDDQWLNFLRLGRSDGGAGVAAKTSASLGFQFTPKKYQALNAGLGWSTPAVDGPDPQRDDEFVLEASYRLQVAKALNLMPDMQIIISPINNPDVSSIYVFGLRTLITL